MMKIVFASIVSIAFNDGEAISVFIYFPSSRTSLNIK